MKWVAVARHGLILWETDATHLMSLFKSILDPNIELLIGVRGVPERDI